MTRAAELSGPRVVLRPNRRAVATWQSVLPVRCHAWDITVRDSSIGRTLLRQHRDDPTWADYSIEIDRPHRRGRGYGTEATRLVLAYAFAALDLTAVQLTVAATNQRAITCYRACGFVAYTMGRRRRQNHYGMLCVNPDRLMTHEQPPLPSLLLADPTSRRITLRKAEAAFLGVGPGARVAVEGDEDGGLVLTPAEVAA